MREAWDPVKLGKDSPNFIVTYITIFENYFKGLTYSTGLRLVFATCFVLEVWLYTHMLLLCVIPLGAGVKSVIML